MAFYPPHRLTGQHYKNIAWHKYFEVLGFLLIQLFARFLRPCYSALYFFLSIENCRPCYVRKVFLNGWKTILLLGNAVCLLNDSQFRYFFAQNWNCNSSLTQDNRTSKTGICTAPLQCLSKSIFWEMKMNAACKKWGFLSKLSRLACYPRFDKTLQAWIKKPSALENFISLTLTIN